MKLVRNCVKRVNLLHTAAENFVKFPAIRVDFTFNYTSDLFNFI